MSDSIGDQPAFSNQRLSSPRQEGMTYRMALIRDIAGGMSANPDYSQFSNGKFADRIFCRTDQIIRQLDAERKGEAWKKDFIYALFAGAIGLLKNI